MQIRFFTAILMLATTTPLTGCDREARQPEGGIITVSDFPGYPDAPDVGNHADTLTEEFSGVLGYSQNERYQLYQVFIAPEPERNDSTPSAQPRRIMIGLGRLYQNGSGLTCNIEGGVGQRTYYDSRDIDQALVYYDGKNVTVISTIIYYGPPSTYPIAHHIEIKNDCPDIRPAETARTAQLVAMLRQEAVMADSGYLEKVFRNSSGKPVRVRVYPKIQRSGRSGAEFHFFDPGTHLLLRAFQDWGADGYMDEGSETDSLGYQRPLLGRGPESDRAAQELFQDQVNVLADKWFGRYTRIE